MDEIFPVWLVDVESAASCTRLSAGVAHLLAPAGRQTENRLKNLTELDITGGSGKFRGIHGIVRAETVSDAKAFNQNHSEFEYWFEK